MIPYSRQSIDESDIAAVVSALKDDILTGGEKVNEFERAIAEYVGVKHVVAMNSATSALHAAYLALGVREGDEVITTPITFAATANAALMAGAEVKFATLKRTATSTRARSPHSSRRAQRSSLRSILAAIQQT